MKKIKSQTEGKKKRNKKHTFKKFGTLNLFSSFKFIFDTVDVK